VEAEATTPDPLEGEPFEETEESLTANQISTREIDRPVQSKVREVLGA